MNSRIAELALTSFAALAMTLSAQTAAPAPTDTPSAAQAHHGTPQQRLNHLSKKLALTADQQNRILPILTDREQQVQSINADTTLTAKDRKQKLAGVRTDSESKLRSVLTDTQRAAYDQMQQEARERAKTRKLTSTTAN